MAALASDVLELDKLAAGDSAQGRQLCVTTNEWDPAVADGPHPERHVGLRAGAGQGPERIATLPS